MTSRKIVEYILATPALRPWWNQNFSWTAEDDEKLRILAAAGADLDRSALALGRSATAIVWHARTLGVTVPAEWAKRTRKSSDRQAP